MFLYGFGVSLRFFRIWLSSTLLYSVLWAALPLQVPTAHLPPRHLRAMAVPSVFSAMSSCQLGMCGWTQQSLKSAPFPVFLHAGTLPGAPIVLLLNSIK